MRGVQLFVMNTTTLKAANTNKFVGAFHVCDHGSVSHDCIANCGYVTS
jgi:hypothetical protein